MIEINEIIHIELSEQYPDSAFEEIKKMLSKYFEKVDEDTFKIKKGVYLRFNKKELIIYELKTR
ncbi:MAG: hypothetical protein JHC26_11470 [Thermofilum sp.]|uniref:hypothetical protein n=1 Tax=Thermofilum sp. TaxID=1961369 RepID=UPI00258DB05C|nr:hypothetical protein [Thermofilum sp.]MCI4409701.1 hypothetical protein [Thermofilum sp.]